MIGANQQRVQRADIAKTTYSSTRTDVGRTSTGFRKLQRWIDDSSFRMICSMVRSRMGSKFRIKNV